VQEQAWPDGASGIGIRRTVDIGLAHDHRFVNGRDAAAFLGALKRLLEQPAWLGDGPPAGPGRCRQGSPGASH
jgi:pyruvate/2-oxoglutarate dehydrogenase complex dihydrolipoamide acyltransferase (E2) component